MADDVTTLPEHKIQLGYPVSVQGNRTDYVK
jgi:hypothetical protein